MISTKRVVSVAGLAAEAEALIREARRRQRRRYAVIGGVAVVAAGALAAAAVGIGPSSPPRHARPSRPHPRKVAVRQPAQIPESANTTLMMWPVQASQAAGVYVDNLGARHFWQPPVPAMDPGEYQPVLPVGRWIVWSDGNVHEVSAANPGHPRLLGRTWSFEPSVTPGYVWLQYRHVVRLVAVPSGKAGPPIAVPPGFQVVAGTKAGLLVEVNFQHLALWNPGAAPVTLPLSAPIYPVAASTAMIAYETGCRYVYTAKSLLAYAGMGYPLCRDLRVYDVATGRLRTFAAPIGTIGWVTHRAGEFWSFTDIAPSGRLIAARALLAPAGRGVTRLYLLRLAGPAVAPTPVPSSGAFFLSEMAWSSDSSWLFYQGPGAHLWAYRPATGRVWSSRTPCCNYEVLAPIGGQHDR